MRNEIIFVRTDKGENEAHSSQMHLSENYKRVLLMVDGSTSIGEISRRAAPSLRSIMDEVISGLVEGGFIQDKSRPGNIPGMIVPSRMATSSRQNDGDDHGELDFTAMPGSPTVDKLAVEAAKMKIESEAKAHAGMEAQAELEAKIAKLKAQQDAEKARQKAEMEKARINAEIEEVMAAAEARERKLDGTIPQAPVQDMLQMPKKDVLQAPAKDVPQMPAQDASRAARMKSGAATSRSTSATVLFFDVVGYTKQTVNKQNEIKNQFNHLVTECLDAQEDGERIILDTGDGAAIGFLQHPEDAMEVAMKFRNTVMANGHRDYPELNVRIGIHLGPINVVKDMNGQNNMVGDGINDAQRVMSFAGIDQIFISRPYYDFISRLNDEYANLFHYRGIKKDKHEREHQVYELVDAKTPAVEVSSPHIGNKLATFAKLEPFSFTLPDVAVTSAPKAAVQPEIHDIESVDDFAEFSLPEVPSFTEVAPSPPAPPAPSHPTPSSATSSVPAAPASPSPSSAEVKPGAHKSAAKGAMPSADEVKKFAEAQSRAWEEAQRRSIEASRVNAEPAARPQPHIATPTVRRKPLPWLMIISGLCVTLLIALFVAPFLMPMKGYVTGIEQRLSASLQQPVHVGKLAGRLLPTPQLELKDVSIGEGKSIHVQQVRADFTLSALFSANKPISGMEFDGVLVNGASLTEVATWLQLIAADNKYPVARIGIVHGRLEADGVQLSEVDGELSFNQAGKFTQAKFQAEGKKLAIEINATLENKITLSLTARDSALPLLPDWVFDDLYVNGELSGESLVISDLHGHIKGGDLKGDARLDWHSGWQAQGALAAKNVAMQNISNTLSGNLDGAAHFQMQSPTLSKLTEHVALAGVFVAKKGVIQGIDVVATARQSSADDIAGGRTHFEELSGEINYANEDYRFKQIKMSAGVLNATGAVDIAKQQLSGRIVADLTKFAGMGTVTLQISGTTDKPALRAIR